MKLLLISFAFLLIVPALLAKNEESCKAKVQHSCDKMPNIVPVCNSRHGGIDILEGKIQNYINQVLATSYDYLLLSTHFNSYQKNRAGFAKLYRELSDKAFDDSIALIKHLARRGGSANFNKEDQELQTVKTLEVDELHSLAIALDSEKLLTKKAGDIYHDATHKPNHDPEFAHYIEDKLLEPQAETIRKLSGYANDLSRLMNTRESSLGIHLFDQNLAKA